MEWLLLAQTGVDPFSGYSGWAGAGLLGLVLAWLLLRHLPDKDKQIERMVEGADKRVDAMIVNFTAELRIVREYAEATFQKERDLRHQERQIASDAGVKMAVLLGENTSETRALVQEIRMLAVSVSNLVQRLEKTP